MVLEHAGVKHGRGPVGLVQGRPLGQRSHDTRGDALPGQTEGGRGEKKEREVRGKERGKKKTKIKKHMLEDNNGVRKSLSVTTTTSSYHQ